MSFVKISDIIPNVMKEIYEKAEDIKSVTGNAEVKRESNVEKHSLGQR